MNASGSDLNPLPQDGSDALSSAQSGAVESGGVEKEAGSGSESANEYSNGAMHSDGVALTDEASQRALAEAR